MQSKKSVEIALPAYNEEDSLQNSVEQLQKSIQNIELKNYKIIITIVDNASTDSTSKIAKRLAKQYNNLNYIHLNKKGRGRALRECWKKSKADVLTYMDIDLSADLKYLSKLVNAVSNDKADIAIGSRLIEGAKVSGRTISREIISRGYNLLIRIIFATKFYDAQCGFKAVSKKAFNKLEPLILNQNWFFDSEMLIIAHKLGMKIKEIPISWKDDPTSTVKIAKTASEDLLGLWRLKRSKPWIGIS